ncbi:hypothetical protein [Pseudonocardia broussonetiae]|uniref:Uncharacterized protein n=1 Tax=Pseudonocardia broussonetiae TaxID=2736640 RepID=A0A6M6JDV5_9PSEU|nr:hypothetical protein [Pseudonocardia broussonetiae]QJY45127.1 hypothetical protein HOP40_04220 [Pseudonocardia broussonetiae]
MSTNLMKGHPAMLQRLHPSSAPPPNSTTFLRRALQRFAATLVALAAGLGLSLASAPMASAEPAAVGYTVKECGWTTCTLYWSVGRTQEFQIEEKSLIEAAYWGAGLTTEAVATIAGGPAGFVAGLPVVAYAGGMSFQFAHSIDGAANDNRCLILKYPRAGNNNYAAGWWGSVAPSGYDRDGHRVVEGNSQCDEANAIDADDFPSPLRWID